MKNILIVIGVLFLVASCMDEDINKNNEPPHLSIAAMKDYIPQNYKKENDIFFINEAGSELRLKTKWKESVSEKKQHKIVYTTDNFEVTLYNTEDLNFQIVLLGTANYATTGTSSIVRGLSGILMPFNPSGSTWAMLNFENGVPKVSLGDDFRESITFNGRDFQDVFINIGKQGMEIYEAYSELDINAEFGVVAFRDANNDLWVFDRFEE